MSVFTGISQTTTIECRRTSISALYQNQTSARLKRCVVVLFLATMMLFTQKSFSQLLTQDFGFSGALTANGWTGHNGTGTNVISTTTGLSYAGALGSGVGNAALVNNLGGEDINITFTNQSGNGTSVYYSFMVNITDAAATKSGDYFLHIGTPGGATFTSFAGRVFARITASGVNFGISNTSAAAYGTTNFAKNTTYLVIVKYTINTGGADNASLWVVSSGVPASEVAAGTAEITTATTGTDAVNTIALRQGSASASPQTVVDGIRVGTTWADVSVGAAAPVVTAASPTGTVGTSFTYNIIASNPPILSYAITSGTLPAGLTLNTGTGAITGTPTTAGSSSVDVTATNGVGTSAAATLSFTINPGNQAITGLPLTDTKTFGDAPYNLTATGGASGNPVTYVSSAPAVADVVGNVVTIYSAGTTTITASQAGNANYNAAPDVTQTLNVNQAAQTITFGALAPKPDNDPNFQLTATGGASGNTIVYTSSNPIVAIIVNNLGNPDPNGDWVDILAAGSTNITASQAGNANYLAATPVVQAQVINSTSLLPQTITGLAATDTRTYGDAIYQLTATGGGSGNPVTYQSLNVAVAIITDNLGTPDPNGTYVKIISNGTATIRASQAGNATYNPAPDVDQLLTVNQKEITVSGAVANDKPYDGTNAAAITGYTVNGIVGADNITVTGGGTFADVNAGLWAVTPALILGGTDQAKYFLTQPTIANATINPASQTITGLAPADTRTFGNAAYNLTATGGASGNPVTYSASPAGVVTIVGNLVTIVGGGVTTITASQAGSSNYNAAADVFQTLTVSQATQTITFAALTNKTTADVPFSLAGTASSLLPVSYTSSNPAVADVVGSLVTIYGPGFTTITASQAGDANYLPATAVARTLIVTAPIIAAWDFTGPGNVATFAATTFNADLSSSNLITRGSTAGASTGSNSFRTTGFKNEGISVANTDYFQTTLTAATGKQLSLSDITGRFNGTSSFFAAPGVTSQFAYSLDGTTFNLIGSPVTSTSLVMLPVDLTGIPALQNVPAGTTVTIRYYASGQTTTGGWGFSSSAVGDNGLAFGGSITTIPCAVTGTASTTSVCTGNTDGTATVTLTGIGSGAPGTYSIDGGPATAYSTNPFTITGLAGGTHTVVATVTATGCVSSSINADVTINSLPTVSFSGLAATYCSTDAAATLTGSPAGGTFSGTGIVGNTFDPAVAGVGGPYTITYTYTDPGTGCSNTSTQQVSVTNCVTTITVNLKLFLQGYYTGTGTMQPVLNNHGVAALPTETDTVLIELHDPTTFALVDAVLGVLSTTGLVSATFTQPAGSYRIAVKHRNTIQTWAKDPIACTVATPLYNFSTAATQAAGDNQFEVEPLVWAFFTGDINQDDFIDGNDFPQYDTESASGGLFDGTYTPTDMNGDGFVDGNDFPVFDVNSFNGVSAVYP